MSIRLPIVAAYGALTLAVAAATVTCSTMPGSKTTTQPGATTNATTTSQPGRGGRGAGGAGRGAGAIPGGRGVGGAAGRGFGGRGGAATRPDYPYFDPSYTLEERLNDLLPRMTLDEKAEQMNMDAPAIERLGINAYHWWNEGLHGVARAGEATVFPQAIAMAASWDTDLHHQAANVIAIEGRAKHHEAARLGVRGQYYGLDFWSPNINIFRDPRWGRGQETYGEDPYLTSRLGIAFVTGLQGPDRFYFNTIATPKHFAVHSGPEMERHRFDAKPSNIDLFTTYLPAFEATVREGRAFSVMAAYQSLNGTSCTANTWLLTDILRKKWGFEGYVTSDVDSVRDVFLNHQHVGTPEEAAAMSVKAGCDLNGGTTYRQLADAVRLGYITEAELDVSLRRLFAARIRLGEFDPPGTLSYASTPITANDSKYNDDLSYRMARESMVLLKNANNTLPLKKDVRSIAVIGPVADSLAALVGNYNGTPSKPITILQGIRNAVPLSTRVSYVAGSPMVTEEIPLAETVPAACFFTDATRTKPGLFGTYYRSLVTTDRPIRTRIDANINISFPEQAVKDSLPYAEGFYAKWTGVMVAPDTGEYQMGLLSKDSFRLTIDDKMVVDEFFQGGRRTAGNSIHLEKDKVYKIVAEYVHPAAAGGGGGGGGAGGAGGGGGGGGRGGGGDTAYAQLRWTRPTADGQAAGADGQALFATAANAARTADAVVVVLGITAELEREEQAIHYAGFDGGDRTSLDLPAVQENLLKAVKAAAGNKPVILVLTSGSALSVNWANDNIAAIVQAWYPGQHGDAVADVLFGNYNPAGRLPVTFYKSVNDIPAFDDYAMGNRTYRYFSKDVLYPFGHGLSYTRFDYTDFKLSSENPTTADNIVATVTVRNAGQVAGDEVVQCYIDRAMPPMMDTNDSQRDAAMMELSHQPRKTLAGFTRINLKPGESRTVEFTITPHQLATVNGKGDRILNPQFTGNLSIRVGPSSVGGASRPIKIAGEAATPTYNFVAPKVAPAAAAPNSQ